MRLKAQQAKVRANETTYLVAEGDSYDEYEDYYTDKSGSNGDGSDSELTPSNEQRQEEKIPKQVNRAFRGRARGGLGRGRGRSMRGRMGPGELYDTPAQRAAAAAREHIMTKKSEAKARAAARASAKADAKADEDAKAAGLPTKADRANARQRAAVAMTRRHRRALDAQEAQAALQSLSEQELIGLQAKVKSIVKSLAV